AVGWIVYAQGETFGAVMAAEIVLGTGSAFMSGADRALLFVSLDGAGRAREYRRWEGRLRAVSQVSEALSAAGGGWLYSLGSRRPLWLQIPVGFMVLASVGALRDVERSRAVARGAHLARAASIVRFTLWRHRRLRAAMLLAVALSLATFVMV